MSTVYVRQKASESFLNMNGIKSKLFDPHKHVTYPANTTPLDSQVAGHSFDDGKSTLGMLKHKDGYVLKPIEKPVGIRELNFYEDLQQKTDPISVELQKFVPEFLGSTTLTLNDKDVKFIVLDNVANTFAEPCIMDIKIGRQTWDPEATAEKMQGEMGKYTDCKRDLAFCIPGFQVYRASTGKVIKLGKDYGKKLNKTTVRDALKLFLNADCGLNRHLMMLLLARLWRILRWCRTQHKYRFYSSSLLLAYDARRLRQSLKMENCSPNRPLSPSLGRAFSFKLLPGQGHDAPLHLNTDLASERPGSSNGGSRNSSNPSTPSTPTSLDRQMSVYGDSWHVGFEAACRTHSLVNNYERDLASMRENYKFDLDDLMSADQPGQKDLWATVRMIDFAHAFPAPTDDLDTNYLEGIENLVKIFESFLEEIIL